MIEKTTATAAITNQNTPAPRKVLTMVKNERMGGYVPKWAAPETAHEQIEQTLNLAAHGIDPSTQNFESALAYSAGTSGHHSAQEEFTFGDLIDMANPLHHIPIVGSLYRGLTGDKIKPISQIIGGAVFGGAVGAASGLVNAVAKEETGKDLTENAMAFVMNGEKPHRDKPLNTPPEQRLENATHIAERKEDLPASLLSFTSSGAETPYRAQTFAHYKNLHHDAMTRLSNMETIPALPAREDITKLATLDMPPKL